MTIKHLLYSQLCAFMYTKGACVVFFRFWNSPMKIFYVIETVASISDQREYMFGDNRSVVTSATLPHSTLSKRHNILAFHRVKEAIAAKIIDFHWIQSEYNLSDMLSKHWENNKIFPMIQKLLITCGPITLIPRAATEEISKLPK